MPRPYVRPLLCMLVLLPLLGACAPSQPGQPATADSSAAATLATAQVAPHPVPRERVWDGVVEAVNQATVSAQTAGRVVALPFDVDDRVPAGAVIVRFTDVEQQAARRQAQAQVSATTAAVREADAEHARISSIYERRLVSRSQLDQATARRDAARAALEAARAALRSAEEQLAYTVVRAPYAGIVTRRFVEVGESVQPGQPLISGIGGGELRVSVLVPQSDVEAIRAHLGASILLDAPLADGSGAFVDAAPAPVRIAASDITVFPFADPRTHTFQVRLALPAEGATLRPGTTVKVAFVVGRETRTTVPMTAVVRRAELSAVYVLGSLAGPDGRDGKAAAHTLRLRQVRLGQRHGDEIEVHAGLRAGERVVRDARAALRLLDEQRLLDAQRAAGEGA